MDGGASRGPQCLAIGLLLDGRKDALSCRSDGQEKKQSQAELAFAVAI